MTHQHSAAWIIAKINNLHSNLCQGLFWWDPKTTGSTHGIRNQIFMMELWDLSENANKVATADGKLYGVNLWFTGAMKF